MKAIVVHEYGGLGVLTLEDAPRPEPKDDQVLIRVIAAGVNPVDTHIRIVTIAEQPDQTQLDKYEILRSCDLGKA